MASRIIGVYPMRSLNKLAPTPEIEMGIFQQMDQRRGHR
jgi:hypothetical protein